MFNNLLRKFYSYSSSCEEEIGTYNCDPCPEGYIEYGGVRSVAFIKETYLATLLATPTTAATWQTGIDNGDIIIIPKTRGSYDPGDPKELKGYGDQKVTYGPRDMTLTWFDQNYTINYPFYNSLTAMQSWVPAFRTNSLVHIFDKVATVVAKDAVEEDIDTNVDWNGIAKVISKNIPTIHSAANLSAIFSCK